MNGARLLNGRVRAAARALPQGLTATAAMTRGRGYYQPLRVTPTSAQTLQWLTPGTPIDYHIVTNLDWTLE